MAVPTIANRRQGRAVPVALCLGLLYAASSYAFVSGFNQSTVHPSRGSTRVGMRFQGEDSTALVKVNEENTLIAASIIPGAVGLILGHSVWLAAGLFVAGAYCARQQGDIADGLKGTSEVSLGLINFGANIVDKYAIGDKISSAFNSAMEKSGNENAAKTINDALGNVKSTFDDVDQEVGIANTLGTFVGTAGELASKAANKVVKLNDEYKLTDKIQEQLEQVTAKK